MTDYAYHQLEREFGNWFNGAANAGSALPLDAVATDFPLHSSGSHPLYLFDLDPADNYFSTGASQLRVELVVEDVTDGPAELNVTLTYDRDSSAASWNILNGLGEAPLISTPGAYSWSTEDGTLRAASGTPNHGEFMFWATAAGYPHAYGQVESLLYDTGILINSFKVVAYSVDVPDEPGDVTIPYPEITGAPGPTRTRFTTA